ncbi:MAG: D-alanyl-D-alanine carboxypeptidase [Pseudomonadales bacterium]|nr:D-alanyl-D-alanine carboxypeptidase [Pseudomonadales bacterium]
MKQSKKFYTGFLFVALMLAVSQAFSAGPSLIPAPPQVAASSYLLMDANTGNIIVEYNGQQQLPPASLTKMMTAYVASHELAKKNITKEDTVRISIKAWKTGGSRMFLKEGSTVSVKELLKGIIIQSGNDASVALAEHIAGSEDAFADYMNRYAENLNMFGTHFRNATGLPATNHLTTASDLAILAQAIINEFPQHYKFYSEKSFTYNGIKQPNRNLLLWRDSSVDGLKTGHTQEAGYCLVASAKKGDMRLISVVMGTKSNESRAAESQKLLTYGFRFYRTVVLQEAHQEISKTKLWMGAQDELKLGVNERVQVTIPRGKKDFVISSLTIEEEIKAPIKAGDRLGTLTLSLDGSTLAKLPLVALEDVEKGGLFKQLIDYLILLIKSFL